MIPVRSRWRRDDEEVIFKMLSSTNCWSRCALCGKFVQIWYFLWSIYIQRVIILHSAANHSQSPLCMFVGRCACLSLAALPRHLAAPCPTEGCRKWQIKGLSLAARRRTGYYSSLRRRVCRCLWAHTCRFVCATVIPLGRRSIAPTLQPLISVIPPQKRLCLILYHCYCLTVQLGR